MRVVPPSQPCSRRAALAVAALYVSAPLGGRPAAAAVEGIPFYARGDQQMLPDQGFEVLLPELIELRGVALPSVRRAVDNADWAEGRRLLEGRGGRDAALATLGSTASILGDEACARHAPAQHTQRASRARSASLPRARCAHILFSQPCAPHARPLHNIAALTLLHPTSTNWHGGVQTRRSQSRPSTPPARETYIYILPPSSHSKQPPPRPSPPSGSARPRPRAPARPRPRPRGSRWERATPRWPCSAPSRAVGLYSRLDSSSTSWSGCLRSSSRSSRPLCSGRRANHIRNHICNLL